MHRFLFLLLLCFLKPAFVPAQTFSSGQTLLFSLFENELEPYLLFDTSIIRSKAISTLDIEQTDTSHTEHFVISFDPKGFPLSGKYFPSPGMSVSMANISWSYQNGMLASRQLTPLGLLSGITQTFEYDASRRLVFHDLRYRFPEANLSPDSDLYYSTRTFYDAQGNMTRRIDMTGKSSSVYSTTTVRTASGKTSTSLGPYNELLIQEFDLKGQLLHSRNYSGSKGDSVLISYTYDTAGRMLSMTTASYLEIATDSSSTHMKYDAGGKIISCVSNSYSSRDPGTRKEYEITYNSDGLPATMWWRSQNQEMNLVFRYSGQH